MEEIQDSKLFLSLTVDWEGEHLKNLYDLKIVRNQIGKDIPLTHFICPAYLTENSKSVIQKINDCIQEIDEVALHIHPLKNIIRQLKDIPFRTEYNFYNSSVTSLKDYTADKGQSSGLFRRWQISGRGVPLSVYKREELQKIISYSLDLLKYHFPKKLIRGFRSGGWLANDTILDVISDLKFSYDSSAVPPEHFSKGYSFSDCGNMKDDYDHDNGIFTEYMLRLWGHREQTIPFLSNRYLRESIGKDAIEMHTQPFRLGKLIEMPNNGGMSDFVDKSTYMKILGKALKFGFKSTQNYYLNFGWHQEGEVENKMALLDFIKSLKKTYTNIKYVTVYQAYKAYIMNEYSNNIIRLIT